MTDARRFRTGQNRLLKLAKILDTADAEHRKKGEPTYKQTKYIHPECGTPACALGHYAANTRGWGLEPDDCSNVYRLGEPVPFMDRCVLNEFAINFTDAQDLFGIGGCNDARTAKQAARYIRQFVARREKARRP